MASPEPSRAPKPSFFQMKPLSPTERILVIVLFVVLYGVGFYFWVYSPYTQRIAALETKYKEVQSKLDAAIAIFHRLDDINARITELNNEMARLDRLVPGNSRAAEFLYACGQWERSTGARVRSLAFSPPAANGDYQEYTVSFTVVGTYSAQVAFLADLEQMDRLVRVDSVTVVPEDTTAPSAGTATGTGAGTGGSAGSSGGATSGGSGTAGSSTGGSTGGGTGGGGTAAPAAPRYPTTDITTAKYVVHLFIDPSKAQAAAKETPGAGLTFTLSEGRKNPFLP